MRTKVNIKSLVLFLLLSQFVTLTHAIEHQFVPNDHGQCLICVHVNDGQNTVFFSPAYVAPQVLSFEKPFTTTLKYDLKLSSQQSIRSPPSIS